MLAIAIQQYLADAGVAWVGVDALGDFATTGPAKVSVHTESDANAELNTDTYGARVQLRSRAPNAVDAEKACRTALELLLAADGQTLQWEDPTGEPVSHAYTLEAISVVTRPTWYPTKEPGEETSCNVRLFVTETPTED